LHIEHTGVIYTAACDVDGAGDGAGFAVTAVYEG